jgi:uncharacterized protein YraI
MKKLWLVVALLAAMLASAPAHAAEIPVVATAAVNLRAGPGTGYPVVTKLPPRARLVLHGCLAGYGWCDVSWGPERGWLAAPYLTAIYRGAPIAVTAAAVRLGVAIVAFDAGYWHRYYLGRPWYRHWRYYYRW